VTLGALILRAYDIKEYQLEGGPAWINAARFEIDAKDTCPAASRGHGRRNAGVHAEAEVRRELYRVVGRVELRASRDFPSPPLKSALQQQLGLRLDEVKGPLDVLVIELVEQPTPN
jgi:hypothetical protein